MINFNALRKHADDDPVGQSHWPFACSLQGRHDLEAESQVAASKDIHFPVLSSSSHAFTSLLLELLRRFIKINRSHALCSNEYSKNSHMVFIEQIILFVDE